MSNNFLKTQDYSTEICNSLGCVNKATVRIVLPVASKSVTLFVCENCAPKFGDNRS